MACLSVEDLVPTYAHSTMMVRLKMACLSAEDLMPTYAHITLMVR
jgi:hypothetical protein